MIKYTTGESKGRRSEEWLIEKPVLTIPKITGEKVIDGVKYYFSGGRQFIAESFDRMFNVVKGKVKGRYSKGDLIGKASVWEDEE